MYLSNLICGSEHYPSQLKLFSFESLKDKYLILGILQAGTSSNLFTVARSNHLTIYHLIKTTGATEELAYCILALDYKGSFEL